MGEKGTRAAAFVEDHLFEDLVKKGPGEPFKSGGWERDPSDHTRALNPTTGQNAYYDEDSQQWIDPKNGQPLSRSGTEPVKPTR